MNLRQALKQSEFFKARRQIDLVTITVEQVSHGFDIFYSGKQRHYLTYEKLVVFLGTEVARDNWIPIQQEERETFLYGLAMHRTPFKGLFHTRRIILLSDKKQQF